MKTTVHILLLLLLLTYGDAGTPCPNMKTMLPCFCSSLQDGTTITICPGMQNATSLELAMKPLKSQIVDRLILPNLFLEDDGGEDNEITQNRSGHRLPNKWLAELRVRDLEIINADLHSCFLCNDALEGQADFLTSLIVKQGKLRGHVCSTCTNGDSSVSTRELRRTPKLQLVDFSYNEIEILDGNAFPSTLVNLKKIVFSNNKISKIYDNAFNTLVGLTELDLSRNRLSSVSRRIFSSMDRSLKILDLSHNSIQILPENMFLNLVALREVKLSNNLLETLPEKTWINIPTNMEKIDVKGNFLVCNCTLHWMKSRLPRATKMSAHCIAPKEVEFQDLKSDLLTLRSAC